MRKVFVEESLQSHFERNGYVKIQLLDAFSIEVLSQLYSNLTEDKTPNGFFSTIGETNPFVDVPGSEFLYKQVPYEPIHQPLEELQQLDNKKQHAVTIDKAKTGFFKKFLINFQ